MLERRYNLAIETTGRSGSVSLGRSNRLIDTLNLQDIQPPHGKVSLQTRTRHRSLDLMPAIDDLTLRHGVQRRLIGQIYLSIGPGSFTGLRIAVATAKTMAYVLGLTLVAVPTVQVAAHNALAWATSKDGAKHLAVCLSARHQTLYTQLFTYRHGTWQPHQEPVVCSLRRLLEIAPRPLGLIGESIESIPGDLGKDVTLLPANWACGRSDAVWTLGRLRADQGDFTDPLTLTPLYARPPEAQELWNKRHSPDTVACSPQ